MIKTLKVSVTFDLHFVVLIQISDVVEGQSVGQTRVPGGSLSDNTSRDGEMMAVLHFENGLTIFRHQKIGNFKQQTQIRNSRRQTSNYLTMAPKNRNAAQAFASDTSALPRERKKKRSRSKHRNETQNATSSIEVDEESPPTKAEKGKKKHQKGDKTKPDSLKDENPSKHSSIQAGSKQQHSATKKEDGNHSTASLQHLASISEKQNSDHSESKSKPRKRQALRAPVFEKGWGTGEVRWSASEDFDKSFLVKGVAEVNFDGFVFTKYVSMLYYHLGLTGTNSRIVPMPMQSYLPRRNFGRV